jgi:hypothetical protein
MKIVKLLLVSYVVVHRGMAHALQRDNVFLHLLDVIILHGRGGVIHRNHPSMPLGRDRGRVEIVNVPRFDPPVLSDGIINSVLIVSITTSIASHVCAELEGIISILGDGGQGIS